nr:hypothetical protein CFP56_28033 [Quercus suber]
MDVESSGGSQSGGGVDIDDALNFALTITYSVDDNPDSHVVKLGKYLLTNTNTSQLLNSESGVHDLQSDKGELYVRKDGSAVLETSFVWWFRHTLKHIDALVDGGADVGWWHFTRFYGNPDTAKCPESWEKLNYLKGTSTLPWLTIGDFNEITGASEKEGDSDRSRQQMMNFNETINSCGLCDFGYTRPKFT